MAYTRRRKAPPIASLQVAAAEALLLARVEIGERVEPAMLFAVFSTNQTWSRRSRLRSRTLVSWVVKISCAPSGLVVGSWNSPRTWRHGLHPHGDEATFILSPASRERPDARVSLRTTWRRARRLAGAPMNVEIAVFDGFGPKCNKV
jgi:hypothetical protein